MASLNVFRCIASLALSLDLDWWQVVGFRKDSKEYWEQCNLLQSRVSSFDEITIGSILSLLLFFTHPFAIAGMDTELLMIRAKRKYLFFTSVL